MTDKELQTIAIWKVETSALHMLQMHYEHMKKTELYFDDYTSIVNFMDIMSNNYSLKAIIEYDPIKVIRHYDTNVIFKNYCDALPGGFMNYFTETTIDYMMRQTCNKVGNYEYIGQWLINYFQWQMNRAWPSTTTNEKTTPVMLQERSRL